MSLLLGGRRALAVMAVAMLAVVTGGALAADAYADADPASDMLLTQSVFYPYTSQVSGQLQKALNAETAAARRADLPIRVALIPGQLDLGGLPTLYEKPQQYADFLDRELSFNTAPPLLVVMPNGFGYASLPSAARAAAASLPTPSGKTGNDLAQSALAAIPKLTAATGHPIGKVTVSSGGGGAGSSSALIVIVAAAAVSAAGVISVRRRPPRRR